MKFFTSTLIAHRGLHSNKYKENTIEAFRNAMVNNYIIELDIQLLKDNVVIVYHDNNLKRLAFIDKEISTCTYDEIKKIKDIKIPTLEEALRLVNGKVPLMIDYKYSDRGSCLEKESTKLLDNYDGIFSIQSFNSLTILWFKLNKPNYARGQLISNIYPKNFLVKYVLSNMFTNIITKPDYIGVNLEMLYSNKVIKLRNKYLVIGYTIKSKKELIKYSKYADNFICDIGKEPFGLLDR